MIALAKKGAIVPPKSYIIPLSKGPGTLARLDMDWIKPNTPPCSSEGVLLEMKLGTIVFVIATPEDIVDNVTRKTMTLGTNGIKKMPINMIRGPIIISISSLTIFVILPIADP